MILYPGCLAEYVYPEIAESARDALSALGLSPTLADEPVCCGIPALYAGDHETAAALARRTIEAIERAGEGPVITICPSCQAALSSTSRSCWPAMPTWRRRAEALAARSHDFSSFAAARGGPAVAAATCA